MRPELINWRPRELLLEAVQRPLDLFSAICGSAYLLVVTLDATQSELAEGLTASSTSQDTEGDAQARRAALRELDATITVDRESGSGLLRPSLLRSWDEVARRMVRPVDQLPPELRRVPCHVLPLRKRAEASFLQHVSVGRARNHDLVLRHPSVSKFHAWFELHDAPNVFVKDVGSQNHTFVNGEAISGRAQVLPGHTVKFGTVECTLCTPEGLWSVMHV